MKKVRPILCLLTFLLTLSPHPSFGCVDVKIRISRFPSPFYIFIGEVTGYTGELKSKRFLDKKTYGLKIKVLETVNLPKRSEDFFEVFPQRGLNCNLAAAYPLKELRRDYPINSKVRVIAIEDKFFPRQNETGQIRSEAPILALNVRRNDLKNSSQTTAGSIFDYSKGKKDDSGILEFELYKDLLRLEKAESENEKVKILERLVFFPGELLDFDEAVKFYLTDPETRERMINKRPKKKAKVLYDD